MSGIKQDLALRLEAIAVWHTVMAENPMDGSDQMRAIRNEFHADAAADIRAVLAAVTPTTTPNQRTEKKDDAG